MNILKGFVAAALLAVAGSASAKDQPIEAPPSGKAFVYIGKMNAFVGAAAPFHFFADDRYVARVKGKKYVRLTVEPGDHVFWASMQQIRNFVKAKVEAGHSYAIYAKLATGVELVPLTRESDDWREFRNMIHSEKPYEYEASEVERWMQHQPQYIEKALAEWKAAGEPAVKLLPDEHID